jgi:hypothetical protein
MKLHGSVTVLTMILLCPHWCRAQENPPTYCSTQKVNGDCVINVDRNYPVTLPTIQMRSGKKVLINVVNPLPFEALTLDPQSLQAISGTDQIASFFSSVFSSLKGVSAGAQYSAQMSMELSPKESDNDVVQQIMQDLKAMQELIGAPQARIDAFTQDAIVIYAQLQEALSPIPRPRGADGKIVRPAGVPSFTPDPWANYSNWQPVMLCEFSAAKCPANDRDYPKDAPQPRIQDMISAAGFLQVQMTLPPPAPPGATNYPIFDIASFNQKTAEVSKLIAGLPPEEQGQFIAKLGALQSQKAVLLASIPAYAAAVSAISKDFQTYFVNILQTNAKFDRSTVTVLGEIRDPRRQSPQNSISTKLLGQQVTFVVNAVNEISSPGTSIPTATQKNAIVTITILYADPKFEVSTGVLFSTLSNRTFANQTTVTQNLGGVPTLGNVVIAGTTIRPIVLPFVGANWRLGHDFLWPDSRRGAIYFSGGVGFNAYNTTAEYVVGPSFSWRSIMLSALLHGGHESHLTQGEFVGQIWCNSSTASGTVPLCSGAPPSPSTAYHWAPAFAIGLSVRIPSMFSGSSGGSSGSGSH